MENYKKYEFELLGSKIFILLPQDSSKKIVEKCYEECLRIDDWYSRFKEHNTLSLLNDNLNQWQEIDEELLYLFSKAKEFEESTNGAFTLHTKTTLEKWGYDSNYNLEKLDDEYELIEDIEKRETLKNQKKAQNSKKSSFLQKILGKNSKNNSKQDKEMESFELDIENSSVLLNAPIEFGGLGKGYALDKMIEICREEKLNNFLINAGGDLYAKSTNKMGFEIYLEDPENTKQSIGTINVDNFALASTSANRRKWKSVHHIIDPNNNRPANNMLASYVKANSGIDADAYATALFVLGFEKAQEVISKLQIEALIISKNNQIWKTKNFKCKLYKNSKYLIIN